MRSAHQSIAVFRDAGMLREHLAAELVSWRAEGFWPLWRAQRFNRRVRRLARLAGLARDEVYRQVEADADAVAAEEPTR